MTLYRHLGPITFQSQTQLFQIFSGCNQTLILQFKNYDEINLEQITQLLAVYQLILKQDKLLEIYSQKNKPSSILVHKAVRVGFQKISIQLLCRIIKQTIVSIFHSKKIILNKNGQINKEMFFQIDGELRYLYFPLKKYDHRSQNIVSDVLQFFNKLKDEKQLSHRLLLKKIFKCSSLQKILQQTQYFLNIYHARQSHTIIPQAPTTQQHFFGKTLTKTKFMGKTMNQNSVNQLRNSSSFGMANESSNTKNGSRRKYNLFKASDISSFKATISPQNHNFTSSTWRKSKKQSLFQNNTFRSNSKAVHIDLNIKGIKNQSTSLFNRASSVNQSPKKISTSKRKNLGFSIYNQPNQNIQATNESMFRCRSRDLSRKKDQRISFQNQQSRKLNQSAVSKNLNDSQCIQKQDQFYRKSNKSQSSQLMKQMVNNSLQKWRQKTNQKGNIFNQINEKDKQRSTQVDSRSKFLQKYERPSYDLLRQSNISSIHPSKLSNKNEIIKTNNNQSQSHHPVGSERKLKKALVNNRSVIVDGPSKMEKQGVAHLIEKNSQQIEFCQNNEFCEKQNNPPFIEEQSLQQIDLCKSSIEHLAMKNKEQQLMLSKKMDRKKTSIKEIVQINNFQKNISDQSQTQRINYSRCSKKNLNFQRQQNKKQVSIYETNIQQFQSKFREICDEQFQIAYIAKAVSNTANHLTNFETIFWQLPMFFLYKKFYQRRLKLKQKTDELLSNIKLFSQKSKDFKQIQRKVIRYTQEFQTVSSGVLQSLIKLIKQVKKKGKKNYTQKGEQQYTERQLHLDYTISYDSMVYDYCYMYLQSLLEAKEQFPQLVYHIVEIFEAILVCKGKKIELRDQQINQVNKLKSSQIKKADSYFNSLIKTKQIKEILYPDNLKKKGKK